MDPYGTITSPLTNHGPVFDLDEDEPVTWTEHFVKGFASLGLLGFAKIFLSAPWNWINISRNHFGGNRGGTTGRDRMANISWIAVVVGIVTILLVSRPLICSLFSELMSNLRQSGRAFEPGAGELLQKPLNESWMYPYPTTAMRTDNVVASRINESLHVVCILQCEVHTYTSPHGQISHNLSCHRLSLPCRVN